MQIATSWERKVVFSSAGNDFHAYSSPTHFNSNLTPVTLKLFLYKSQFHSASHIVYYGEAWAIHHADNRRQFGAQMRFSV
jgi:hypothetical protein